MIEVSGSPQRRWRKSPKFILRQDCVAQVTATWPPGAFLEVGAGSGTMTRFFLERGFAGVCSDISEATCAALRDNLSDFSSNIQIVHGYDGIRRSHFDYLFAFEVLEHVPEDLRVLRKWLSYLREGGRALITVPAHAKKYGRADSVKGHIRRYERAEVLTLLSSAGLTDVAVVNYGFPLGNVTRRIQSFIDFVLRPDKKFGQMSPEERSILSGQQSTRATQSTAWLVNERSLFPFIQLQRLFFSADLGDGYVATGTLRGSR